MMYKYGFIIYITTNNIITELMFPDNYMCTKSLKIFFLEVTLILIFEERQEGLGKTEGICVLFNQYERQF